MMARKVNSGYVLIFAAGILWGTIGLFVKQMEECGSVPAMTTMIGIVIYRERLGIFSIFGVLLVLVSILIMNPSNE